MKELATIMHIKCVFLKFKYFKSIKRLNSFFIDYFRYYLLLSLTMNETIKREAFVVKLLRLSGNLLLFVTYSVDIIFEITIKKYVSITNEMFLFSSILLY